MAEYKGSIELISGLTQKNNLDFPLIEAHSVAVGSDEVRLDDKLKELEESTNLSQDLKDELVRESKEAVFIDTRFTNVNNTISTNAESIAVVQKNLAALSEEVANNTGDNADLKLAYHPESSILYLYTGDDLNTDEQEGNVITQTFVTGGGGGSASSYELVLRILDENPSFSLLKGRSAILNYNAELKDGEGTIITAGASVKLYVYVNNILKQTLNRPVGQGTIDVTPYLILGNNNIKVTAAFSEVLEDSGETVTIRSIKYWSVELIEMFMTSDFSDATVKTGDISFPYIAYGNLDKTIYFYLDGKPMIDPVTIAGTTGPAVIIPMQSHGVHTFEVWCTGKIGSETIESEHLYFEIMFAEEGNTTPIIRMTAVSTKGQQYSTSVIKYSVYSSDKVKNMVSLLEDGEVVSSKEVDRSEQTWLYKPLTHGTKELGIQCGDVIRTITLEIEEFKHEISPILSGLELDFLPQGRTNQDTDRDVFYNNVAGKEDAYDWILSDNFDWVNGGWQADADGNSFFCVKAGTSATINYNLFADPYTVLGKDNAPGNGKEFKLIFKTTNVADVDTTFLACQSKAIIGDNLVGLEMKGHRGYMRSNTDVLDIPYSEEDIIEFDININPATLKNGAIDTSTEKIPMVLSYEDGTPFRPMTYTSTSTSFTQATPVPIVIGSKDCDVHIYRMKAYGRALSHQEILNNFIADGKSAEEMVDRFTRNQIYNQSGVLTPESLADARPDLKVLVVECPHFTTGKDIFVGDTSVRMIHRNGDPKWDNWIFSNGFHTAQGTTSSQYGDAAFNIDLLMCFDGEYKHKKILKQLYPGDKESEYWNIRSKLVLGDGTVIDDGTGKIGLTSLEASIPTSYFNVKVNVASSENANNALIAKLFNQFLPYRSVGNKRDPRVKNTMEFVNCVVFIREFGPEGTHTEFEDNDYHFYAIGNIGDSKKTDQTRAYDPDDAKEFVVEIMDNNMPNASFQTGYYLDEDKPIPELIKYPIDKELWCPGNPAYDSLMADPWDKVSFEMRYEHPDISDEQNAANIQIWYDFYEWVITSSDEDFYNHLKDWVNVDAALYYYLFTERYTMMDNRAKNSFWHWAKLYISQEEADTMKADAQEYGIVDKSAWYIIDDAAAAINEGYRFDWWDYDNDTSLGIDNSGQLRMPYGKEDYDRDEKGAFYFNAAESVPYRRLSKLFKAELQNAYQSRENTQECWNPDYLIKLFDNWQNQFPEAIWIADTERKYLRPYRRNTSTDHLNKRLQGRKKYHRRQWERDQSIYMASKYASMLNRNMKFLTRATTPSDPVVAPNYDLQLIPYSDMYLNLLYGVNSELYSVRAKAGQLYTLACPFTNMHDVQMIICGSNRIQSIGDISKIYPSEGTFDTGEKLKTLIIGNGTPGYTNTAIKNVSIGANNKMLEYLDIQNLADVKTVYLGISNLKYFYAQGSGITEASFANNGLLEEAYLPAAINSVVANNLYYLNTLSFEGYDSLNKLVITNCPQISNTTQEIVSQAKNLSIVRLTNVDWTFYDTTVLNRLLKCSGVQEDSLTLTDQSVLTGRVWVPEIRASEKAAYKAAWPELTVEYGGEIQQKQVSFMNEGKPACDPILVDVNTTLSAELHDPVVNGTIPAPTKEQTAQYSYVFDRWEMIDGTKLPGYLVKDNVTFHAKYREVDRYYNVMWYDDDPATTPTAKPLLEQPIKVIYGGSTQYPLEGFPTKNPTGNGDYFLFEKWSEPATNIVADTNIYGIWATSNTKDLDPKNGTLNLKPIDLFAIKNEPDNSEKSLSNFFKNAGDSIKVQLGYMPDYDDVDSIVFTEAMKKYNGTLSEKVDTGIKLLDSVDKGFTLALDYSVDYSSSRTTLLSCYFPEANGILIEGVPINTVTNTSFTFADTSVDIHHTPITAGEIAHREICVIRKPKGEAKIYIYTNNRYTNNPIARQELIYDSWNDINSTLHFGANVYTIPSTGLVLEDYPAKGSIYYAKLWNDDIGDEECKKVCSWIYDTMEFAFVGSNTKYWMTDSTGNITGLKSKASFMSKQLLDEPVKFNISYSTDKVYAGYSQSDIRKWLNDKVFKGMDPQWRQLMQSVRITSLQGISNQQDLADAYADPSILIRKKVNTSDYLYLPSAKELSPSFPNDGGMTKPTKFEAAYREEMSPNDSSYELFGTPSSRVKTLSHSNLPAGYWTRSPWFPSEGSPNFYGYHYGVAPGNTATTGSYSNSEPGGLTHIYTTSDNPNSLKYFRRDNAINTIAQGVPICFSI